MKAVFALLVMLCINVMLFLGQVSIDNINPVDGTQFFNSETSTLGGFNGGNYTLNTSFENDLPSSDATVAQDDSGNFFTDTWNTIKNWFYTTTGIIYLKAMVSAFPTFLEAIQLPQELVFALGALWYIIGIMLIIILLKGGS